MKPIFREVLIVLIFLCLGFCVSYFALPRHGTVVYNCSIAEISPDFPPDVREECRRKNIQKGMWVPK
jgi:hypothetical protein